MPAESDIITRCVLVADDDREWVEALAEILRQEGYVVMTAHDGVEALECASRIRPDAVILDLRMPNLGGDIVARVLRRHPDALRPTLIGITGWPGAKESAPTADGFDVVLSKPVDIATLLALLACSGASPTVVATSGSQQDALRASEG